MQASTGANSRSFYAHSSLRSQSSDRSPIRDRHASSCGSRHQCGHRT